MKPLLFSAAASSCLLPWLGASELRSPFESLPAETIAAFRFDNSEDAFRPYVERTKLGALLFSPEKIDSYKSLIRDSIEAEEKGQEFLSRLGEYGLNLDDLFAMVASDVGAAVVNHEVPGLEPMPTVIAWAEMDESLIDRVFDAIMESGGDSEALEREDLELPGGPGARLRSKDGSSFLISRLENRIIFTLGMPQQLGLTAEDGVVLEQAEAEALGRFMTAQLGEGADFLSVFYADPGVSSLRPDHEVRLELLGDIGKALTLVGPAEMQQMKMFDIDTFTKVAAWSGLVEDEERTTLFIGAPAPRVGLPKLMEADYFEFNPPAWVPSATTTYYSIAADMLKVFDFGVELAKKNMPPEMVEQTLAQFDGQLQAMLQTDISTILSGFGGQVHFVDYPVEIVEQTNYNGEAVPVAQQSQAMVFDYSRPEILQAAVSMLQNMGAIPGLEFFEEQGFVGVRTPGTPLGDVSVAFGFGKLVYTVGPNSTASRTFSAIANPPEGEAALANSEELRAFLAAHSPKPGTLFSYSQGDALFENLTKVFDSLFASFRGNSEESEALARRLEEIMPTSEELKGLMGASFSRMHYNDSGIIFEGFTEYR